MLTAELRIEDGTIAEVEQLLAGRAEVQITAVSVSVGSFDPHDLHEPLRIEALSPVASTDPAVEVRGALVLVHIKRPKEN